MRQNSSSFQKLNSVRLSCPECCHGFIHTSATIRSSGTCACILGTFSSFGETLWGGPRLCRAMLESTWKAKSSLGRKKNSALHAADLEALLPSLISGDGSVVKVLDVPTQGPEHRAPEPVWLSCGYNSPSIILVLRRLNTLARYTSFIYELNKVVSDQGEPLISASTYTHTSIPTHMHTHVHICVHAITQHTNTWEKSDKPKNYSLKFYELLYKLFDVCM